MIPVFKPTYNKDRILKELGEIFDTGWTGLGPKTKQFEEEFAQRLRSPYAVFLNSCTSALHLALECLDLPKPCRIMVPDITFVSTVAAVVYAGHIPVIAPVDAQMQLDLDFVEKWASHNGLSCVVPVHYSGSCCDMDRLLDICRRSRDHRDEPVHIVEDCAHAMGADWEGQPLGTFGDMGCFSFHAVKNLPIGDGGMVIGQPQYAQKLRTRRWLGIDKSTYDRTGKTYSYSYDIKSLGFKYHGNDIMAVIGLANMEILDQGNARRRQIYERYAAEFPDRVIRPHQRVRSSHHLVAVRVQNRDRFIEWMNQRGVDVSVHYKPVSSFDYYRQFATSEIAARSLKTFQEVATLPCFAGMTDQELDQVVEAAKPFFSKYR